MIAAPEVCEDGAVVRRVAVYAAVPLPRAPSLLAAMGSSARIPAFFIDASNSFDPYAVSAWARLMRLDAEDVLKGIMIARAFTCYQLADLLTAKLAAALEKAGPQNALVVISQPITSFGDEDVGEAKARSLFSRAMKCVKRLSEGHGACFAFFQNVSAINPRRAFFLTGLSLAAQLTLTAEGERESGLPAILDGVRLQQPAQWNGKFDCVVRNLIAGE